MQKIAENKIRKQGIRGYSITFPKVVAQDNNLEPGDVVDVYRDTLSGKDAIIIVVKKSKEHAA
jgi:bifunctional DNA-binding transcriptional regulator/antitoxin component of YhaV-PrlF toxin-antitoxin module